MYWKSAVPCKRLFSSAGYIVNKTSSSLEQNTVFIVSYACVVGYPPTSEWEDNFVLFTDCNLILSEI